MEAVFLMVQAEANMLQVARTSWIPLIHSVLISRIENETIEEVILATDLTMEGEITAMYISKLLSKFENLTVTRLAHGLPMGAQLDYADEMTLFKAFSNRKIL